MNCTDRLEQRSANILARGCPRASANSRRSTRHCAGRWRLVDTNFRATFSFAGPDRHRYLNALLTSNVRDLKPGQGTVGLLLNPQGHILAEIETFALESRILAMSHAMVNERTYSTFDKFIIMDDVELEDVTPLTRNAGPCGPARRETAFGTWRGKFADMPLLSHEEVKLGQIHCRIVRREIAGEPAATLIVPREYLANLWRELSARVRAVGGAPAGMEALNSVRLELGTPWFGIDYRRQANTARGGPRTHAHQLRKRMLHRPGNRRAGALARSRQPAAHGAAVFRRRGAASRNELAARWE